MSNGDDRIRAELGEAVTELRKAEGSLEFSVREIFVDPQMVMEKLERVYKAHTKEDMVERLEKNPGTLGKMHGKMALNQLNNPLKPNDAKRTNAELKFLVPKIGAVVDAKRKVAELQSALYRDDTPPRGGRDGPSGRG